MRGWLVPGGIMLALLVPCAFVALRGSLVDRLVGLQLGNAIMSLVLLVLAEGFNRSIYFDLALVYTVMSFGGTLAYIRFLERWA